MTSNKKPARRERREFSEEFKAEAVRMVAERRAAGATLTQVGRELDVLEDLQDRASPVRHPLQDRSRRDTSDALELGSGKADRSPSRCASSSSSSHCVHS